MERAAGVLLAISSLPSPHGIGSMGREAYAFIDFLAAAGQSLWQLLPVGPPARGNSPYSAHSSYAGSPLFIDLGLLREDGLLRDGEWKETSEDIYSVDYNKCYIKKMPLLRLAAQRVYEREGDAVEVFVAARPALSDYALFMALRRFFGDVPWTGWEQGARCRDDAALARYRAALQGEIRLHAAMQYLFFRQWAALRAYAAARGVRLIGDLPFYVPLDSADVWSAPALFQMDAAGLPARVAGVPPDLFSPDGQLWDNPLYDWEAMRRDGFDWWLRRVQAAAGLFDALRIDHFRAVQSYWSVPSSAETARVGRWERGPGIKLVSLLQRSLPRTRFIAEDLGGEDEWEIVALLQETGLPGMRVLQFAFGGGEDSMHLPDRYPKNCVCYTGTHDNDTLAGWWAAADGETRARAATYLTTHCGAVDRRRVKAAGPAPLRDLIRCAMESPAAWFVAPMQDWLGLSSAARMNTPGVAEGNWRWRLAPGAATPALAAAMRDLTARGGRLPEVADSGPGA